MIALASFLLMMLVGVLFPKGLKFLVIAPFLGFILGVFVWSVSAMIWSQLVTLSLFGTFIGGGVALAELVALVDK